MHFDALQGLRERLDEGVGESIRVGLDEGMTGMYAMGVRHLIGDSGKAFLPASQSRTLDCGCASYLARKPAGWRRGPLWVGFQVIPHYTIPPVASCVTP